MKRFAPRLKRFVVGCVAVLGFNLPTAQAQEGQGGDGILSGIRDVLSFRSPAKAFLAAMRIPVAEDALPAMKDLADNQGDAETAARAALWVGLYFYGGGSTRDALTWFETAEKRQASAETRARSRFWVEHCRNLLGVDAAGAGERGSAGSIPELLSELALGDSELRRGRAPQALKRYLAQEGDARRLGCLGPVYYRVALVLATAPAMGRDAGIDLAAIRNWERNTISSPERALAALLREEPDTGVAADSTRNVFAPVDDEPGDAEVAERDSTPGTPDPTRASAQAADDSRAETGRGDSGRDDSGREVYAVQLGAFRDRDRARSEMERLTQRGLSVRLDRESNAEGEWFRIRLGREASREAAERLAERVCAGLEYSVVRLEGSRGER